MPGSETLMRTWKWLPFKDPSLLVSDSHWFGGRRGWGWGWRLVRRSDGQHSQQLLKTNPDDHLKPNTLTSSCVLKSQRSYVLKAELLKPHGESTGKDDLIQDPYWLINASDRWILFYRSCHLNVCLRDLWSLLCQTEAMQIEDSRMWSHLCFVLIKTRTRRCIRFPKCCPLSVKFLQWKCPLAQDMTQLVRLCSTSFWTKVFARFADVTNVCRKHRFCKPGWSVSAKESQHQRIFF